MKILSIDDSEVMRAIIANAGEVIGTETIGVETAEEGLDVLERESANISLILLDYNLPGINGLECLLKIRAEPRWKNIPVMMVTTETDRAVIVKAIQSGADNYLAKPFSPEDLTTKIMETLESGI